MKNKSIQWPPHVTIKKHARTRHVKIQASVKNGLELIVPKRFNITEIPEILELNRAWIEKQLIKLQDEIEVTTNATLPHQIEFPCIKETWKIKYILGDNSDVQIIKRPHQEIALTGNIKNKKQCQAILITWIKNHARKHLSQELEKISQKINLPFKKITIRDQSTRWASCSADKVINLNYKLIFLPLHLMRYIMIHELCHTVHFDHSERFWRLVEKHDPSSERHRREVREADGLVPAWVRCDFDE